MLGAMLFYGKGPFLLGCDSCNVAFHAPITRGADDKTCSKNEEAAILPDRLTQYPPLLILTPGVHRPFCGLREPRCGCS